MRVRLFLMLVRALLIRVRHFLSLPIIAYDFLSFAPFSNKLCGRSSFPNKLCRNPAGAVM
jgi:hypothetical protein